MVICFGLPVITAVLLGCAISSVAQTTRPLIHPFPLSAVRLNDETLFAKAAELNRQYIMSLSVDSMLYTFRNNAGFPTPGETFAGSWEDVGCEVRGQFMGHFLSATATLLSQTDDAELAKRMDFILAELKKVQDKLGDGYLSAFPAEHFERLRNLQPVWAPFYVMHKLMAGLFDQHLFTGSDLALEMVTGMAGHFVKYVDDVIKTQGEQHWLDMLNNEFGGMAEVLYNLYDVTKDKDHLRLAHAFTKPSFYEPLVALEDPLAGLHANTHVAQVNSFAAQYEKTGDKDAFTAVRHFFDIVTQQHSYPTGGNNVHEFWGPPETVADAIKIQGDATETEEICTQYNMLKIARYLFRWTGNVTYADYYERAITNGLLGTQRMPEGGPAKPQTHAQTAEESLLTLPGLHSGASTSSRSRQLQSQGVDQASAVDVYSANWRQAAFAQFGGLGDSLADVPENAPGPGVLLYLLPMGAGNVKGDSTHGWGTPLHSFWCCYGSSVESFAKLVDSIYFYRMNKTSDGHPAAAAAELYINQLVSSSLDWQDVGLRIKQTASFEGPKNTALTKLEFESDSIDASPQVVIKLRIPSWVAEGAAEVRLNGQPWKECHQHGPIGAEGLHGTALSAGSYCSLKGGFKTGDVITAKLPMIVRAETIQDNRPEFQSLKAVMMGPLTMAGLTDGSREITANASDLASLVSDVKEEGLVSLKLLSASDTPLSTPPGTPTQHLQHTEEDLNVGEVAGSNAAKMSATFRIVQLDQSTSSQGISEGKSVAFESMDRPGHYVCRGQKEGSWQQLRLQALQPGSQQLQTQCGFTLTKVPSSSNGVGVLGIKVAGNQELHDTIMQESNVGSSEDKNDIWLAVEGPLIRYPDGSKMLTGKNEKFVLSPLGNIVEERYTVYFNFTMPESS